jgi:hypothetical protein
MPWDEFSFLFNSPTSSKKGDAHGIGLTGDMGEGLVKYLFFGDIRCAYVASVQRLALVTV